MRTLLLSLATSVAITTAAQAQQAQPGAGTQPPAGAGTQAPAAAGSSFMRYGQQPWFGEPGVRQQLKLTDDQFNRLNQSYGNAYSSLQNSMSGLGTLNERDRQARLQQNYGTFSRSLGTAYQDVLTADQQARFNQLWSQYRGYDALLDPTTSQKLNLTEQQIQDLRKYDAAYQQRMQQLWTLYGTNKDMALNAYKQLQPEFNQQLSRTLNPEQLRQWQQMNGDPYRFTPFYGYTTTK